MADRRPPRCYERPRAGDEAVPLHPALTRRVVDGWPLSPITYERLGEHKTCLLSTWVIWVRRNAVEYRRGGMDLLAPGEVRC